MSTPFRNQCIQVGDVVQSIGSNANRRHGEEFVVRRYDKSKDLVWYAESCRTEPSNFRIVRKNTDGIGFRVGDKVIKCFLHNTTRGKQDPNNFREIKAIDNKATGKKTALLDNGEIKSLSSLMLIERTQM